MKRLLLLATLLIPVVALAESPLKKLPDDTVPPAVKAEIDPDGNGLVSKAEFMAYQEKRFTEADANKDGSISDDEHKASMSKWRARRDEWRAQMKATMPPQPDSKPATDKP